MEEVIVSAVAAFQKIDESGNGTIQRNEFARVMQLLDPDTFTKPCIDEILEKFDPDVQDEVDYKSFVDWAFASDPTSPTGSKNSMRKCFESHSKSCWTAVPHGPLLTHFDAGVMPDPQADLIRDVRMLGTEPTPADGFLSFEVAGRRPTFAWKLGAGSTDGEPSWRMSSSKNNGKHLNQLTFEPFLHLPSSDFTCGLWVRWCETETASPVLRFQPKAMLQVTQNGLCFNTGSVCQDAPKLATVQVPRGGWMLLLLDFIDRHKCDVFGAFDEYGLRCLGELQVPSSCDELCGLAGGYQAGHLAQFALWDQVLSKSERLDWFLGSAQRYGCLSEAQANALQVGKIVREPCARNAFEKALARARSEGVADFIGICVVNDDLPEILEAVALGRPKSLNLPGALIDPDGVHVFLDFLCQNPHVPVCIDLTGCVALAEMRDEVMQRFPYHRGISLEAGRSGLAEEHLVALRNRNERAQQALEAAAKEEEQCAQMVSAFMSQQASLEALVVEDQENAEHEELQKALASLDEEPDTATGSTPAENQEARSVATFLCHPRRWRPGMNTRAIKECRDFLAANPDGLIVDEECPDDGDDIESWRVSSQCRMTGPCSEDIIFSRIEYYQLRALARKTTFLYLNEEYPEADWSYVRERSEAYEEDEEMTVPFDPDEMYIPEMSLLTQHVRQISDDDERDFGTRGYVGFMVWCGVRIDPFQVASEVARVTTRRQMMHETGLDYWEWHAMMAEGTELEMPETAWTQEKYDQQLESTLTSLCDPEKREAWLAEHKKRVKERLLLLQAQGNRRDELTKAACAIYDTKARPEHVASGQMIAHFTYLCLAGTLVGGEKPIPHGKFQLKHASDSSRTALRFGKDLHAVLASGDVKITKVTGHSFGKDSVQLALQNCTDVDIDVVVRQGSIFQHVKWVHRQNLMVVSDVTMRLLAGGTLTKGINAYCMNSMCGCPHGEELTLTEFYVDNVQILMSQMSVWNHFNECFAKLKPEIECG